jgi:tetratricopeptide (TPR) repeat protein
MLPALHTALARLTSPLFAFFVAGGCAALGPMPAPGAQAGASASAEVGAAGVPALDATPPETPPPTAPTRAVPVTESPFYKLLVAEVAGHRDRLDLSVGNYLEVARQTRDPKVAERATRIAVYARNDASALEAARLWVELVPSSHEARRVVTGLYLKAGRFDEAVAELRTLFRSINATPAQTYALLVEMLARERDPDLAFAVMERFVADGDDPLAGRLALAQLALRRDAPEKVQGILAPVLEAQPENQSAVLLLAQALQSQGRVEAALPLLERALAARPDDATLRVAYGRLLVAAKRYDDAVRAFTAVVEASPDNAEARYALALLLLQSERLDDAEHQLRALVETKGARQTSARYYLGQLADTRGKLDEALEWYRQVERGEHFLDAQVRYGVILAKQGRLEEARQHLQGVEVPGEREQVRLYLVEAELLTDAGRLDDAMAIFDLALSEYPGDADLLYSRAMLAEKMDRLDLLEQDLRQVLEKDPDHVQALNALGYTLADRTERLQEAQELIARALQLRPDDYYILDSMGWVLYRLGRYPEALEYLRRAASLSDDPEIVAHLGEVLWVSGDQAGARAVWEASMQRRPDDKRVPEVMRRFAP